jgi:uncharacterized protein
VTFWQALLVLVAGVAAGTINTVVGSGTLITFPVLLSVGIAPVTANVSNNVGLLPGYVAGAFGYRRELAGQHPRVLRLGVASTLGGLAGAVLLLVLPSAAFHAIVPVLIVIALLLVVFGPRLTDRLAHTRHRPRHSVTAVLWVLVLLSGVYGGYFGAAQGVLLMGIFGVLLADDLQRQNALKNVLSGFVSLVAAVVFVLSAHVDWAAAALIAAGSIAGAALGARVGRRLSPAALRAVIVVVGLAAIVKLLA